MYSCLLPARRAKQSRLVCNNGFFIWTRREENAELLFDYFNFASGTITATGQENKTESLVSNSATEYTIE